MYRQPTNDAQIRALIQSARQAAERGLAFEAQRFHSEAERQAPQHPLVLNELAIRLICSGNSAQAEKLLSNAVREEPANTEFLYNHAIALRRTGQLQDAARTLDRLLAVEPGHMGALLEKASIQQQRGDSRAAAMTYHRALRLLPPNFKPPQWMEEPLKRAREAVDLNNRGLEEYIANTLAPVREKHERASLGRFDRCVEALLQKRRIFRQQPTFMCYPELPAIEFYSRDDFPWVDDLEAAADDIREELETVLEEGKTALDPYVADQPGLDLKYYKDLNQSRRWGVYSLWREGVEFPDHVRRCPRTAAALKSWPRWDVPGSGPTALFSILDSHSHIPAHTGPVNTRLVVHLALIVPPNCRFRVGGQVREWEEGKAFIFDDTISHEAWNDGDKLRAVLIVDTWSPLLSEAERELVRALTVRMHEWYGQLSRDLMSS